MYIYHINLKYNVRVHCVLKSYTLNLFIHNFAFYLKGEEKLKKSQGR